MIILPHLHPSYQKFFSYVLPSSLSHIYIRPARRISHTSYQVHNHTFTSVLPGVFLIRLTMSIITHLHPFYQKYFAYVFFIHLTKSIITHLHPSYQTYFSYVLPCPLSHIYIRPTRRMSNLFYHIHYSTFTSVLP